MLDIQTTLEIEFHYIIHPKELNLQKVNFGNLFIKKILKESEEILVKRNLNFIYPETQIYRKNKLYKKV